jgi:hypothetical protein
MNTQHVTHRKIVTLIAENLGEITAHPDKGKQISANCIVHEKQITVLNILN